MLLNFGSSLGGGGESLRRNSVIIFIQSWVNECCMN